MNGPYSRAHLPLLDLLRLEYGLHAVHLHPLNVKPAGTRGVYRVERGSRHWVLRVYQERHAAWLADVGGTLVLLAQLGYAAPRVRPARSGRLIGSDGERATLLLTYVEGVNADYGPHDLKLLGSALGRLHSTTARNQSCEARRVQKSFWHPLGEASTRSIGRLARALPEASAGAARTCQTFLRALSNTERWLESPLGIVHGDTWPANAIRTPTGEVILIDWDCAGFGPVLLEIAGLIVKCQREQPAPAHWHSNPEGIRAAMAGYSEGRALRQSELVGLGDAIRFCTALHAADRLADLILAPRQQDDPWLGQVCSQFEASDEMAEIARACCTRCA